MSLLNFPKELKSTANTHNFYFVPSSGKPDFLLLLCAIFTEANRCIFNCNYRGKGEKPRALGKIFKTQLSSSKCQLIKMKMELIANN